MLAPNLLSRLLNCFVLSADTMSKWEIVPCRNHVLVQDETCSKLASPYTDLQMVAPCPAVGLYFWKKTDLTRYLHASNVIKTFD